MNNLVPTNLHPGFADPKLATASRGVGDGTVEVADVWRILWRRRKWMFASVAILTLGALFYCLITPSIYSANVQILVDPHDQQVTDTGADSAAVAADSGLTQAETQVSIVESADVLQRAIAATHLADDPEFNRVGLMRRVANFLHGILDGRRAKPQSNDQQERVLSALRRHVTVKRADKVLVVSVGVTAQDPDKAAAIANAIGDAYLADQADARAAAARKVSAELTARLAEQKRRVLAAAAAVENYRAAHDMVAATGQLVTEQQLAEVNRQLTDAQDRTSLLKSRLDQITRQRAGGAPADAIPEVLQSTVIGKLREQEAALVERESALASQVGSRFPALTEVRSQLRDIRQLIDAELNRIAASTEADYSRALATQGALASKLENLKQQTLSTDAAAIHLKELERDLEAVRSVYANYLVRSQETREQANVNRTEARIVTRALPPMQRSWPPTTILLSAALIAGLAFGAGLALLAESLAPTVLSIRQMQTIVEAPVVGVLPAEAKSDRRRRFGGWSPGGIKKTGPNDQKASAAARTEVSAALALHRLFEAGPDSKDRISVRSVLVTAGVSDAEECERIADLLAVAAADLGERVLLADADLTGNQESAAAGLLDVLRGERSIDSVVHFEATGKLAYLPKGRRQAAFKGRVGQAFARRMLMEARHRFDLVVVNGGAAAENLMAAPLAAVVDEVLVVGRLDVTPVRDVVAASEALSIMGRSATAALLINSEARG